MEDGTYDFNDLCEVNFLLDWKEENARLYRESQEKV
jgi:hypothetical protein